MEGEGTNGASGSAQNHPAVPKPPFVALTPSALRAERWSDPSISKQGAPWHWGVELHSIRFSACRRLPRERFSPLTQSCRRRILGSHGFAATALAPDSARLQRLAVEIVLATSAAWPRTNADHARRDCARPSPSDSKCRPRQS
jgi:hypothetical protein